MKKIILSVFCLLLLLPVPSHALPAISFVETVHDFGTLGEAEKVEHIFEFTNSGDQDLVIERISSS
ncbi:MAG: DUF1573 domain-containing protein [Nitrospirae bacterium]|nr:DUF1573 domain-containing protein [Nitrospirota bacterium]